jgi:WD40 repeat protein
MADQTGILRIWDWSADPAVIIRQYQLAQAVNDIGWDVSGSELASVDDAGSITVFDMVNYQPKPVFTRQPIPGTPINALAWAPYDDRTSSVGKCLAVASDAGWIAIWRMRGVHAQPNTPFDGSYLLEGHNSPVVSLSWSPNHNWLVSVSEDRRIIVWDALTGQRLAQQILDAVPSDISWAPVGATFAVTDMNGYVSLFNFSY